MYGLIEWQTLKEIARLMTSDHPTAEHDVYLPHPPITGARNPCQTRKSNRDDSLPNILHQ